MAKFNRYDNRWDSRGDRRSEEELDRMELEFNNEEQLKIKKMIKSIGAGILGFILLSLPIMLTFDFYNF